MVVTMTNKRWKIVIEYNGRPYSGWQRQTDGIPSVQAAIEDAIYKFCQQDITIHAAGRTDAGVHALGQVAHFDLDYGDRPLSAFDLRKAINAHLRDESIAIVQAEEVSADFQARFDAKNKLYIYKILNRSAPEAISRGTVWHAKKPLDVAAMQEAATVLLGHHDFTTFRDSQCQAKSPMRTLDRLDIIAKPRAHDGQDIEFHLEALSFLHHQVRNIVGTLALVGNGKWTKDDLKAALEAKDRTKGGPTAPSDGLYLVRIDY